MLMLSSIWGRGPSRDSFSTFSVTIPLYADHVNFRQRRNNATMIQAQATMRRIGLELIHEKRQALADQMTAAREGKNKEADGFTTRLSNDATVHVAEPSEKKENWRASTPLNEVLNSKGLEGRDLLSVLSECSIHIHTATS